MAIERRDYQTNGRMYSLLLPPPTQALPLCNRLATLLGPLLPILAGDAKEGGWENFAGALKSLDPVAVNKLMMDAVYVAHLCCDNQPISTPEDFDKHFMDKRSEIYPVLIWTTWECVKDFFPKLEGSPLAKMAGVASAFQMGGQ